MKELTPNNFTLFGTDKDGYDVVIEELLEATNRHLWGTYIVQLGIRYSTNDEMNDITEVFTVDEDGNVEWINDWWEGQDYIAILGFAPLDEVDISKSFPFPNE